MRFTRLAVFAVLLNGSLRAASIQYWPKPLEVVSAFRNHVSGVFFLCSKEQMVGIYAKWIITPMQHVFAFRNWPTLQKPCRSLKAKFLAAASSTGNIAISIAHGGSGPQMALPKVRNMRRNWSLAIDLREKAPLKGNAYDLSVDCGEFNVRTHSISAVDCLPRLRLFVQRGGNFA